MPLLHRYLFLNEMLNVLYVMNEGLNSLTFRMLIIFFIAVDAPVLPNFQHCYLPGIRIMIVYYVAASKASILCSSNILFTSARDYNRALCCYYKNNFKYVNCETRGIMYIHCSGPVF